MIEVIGHESGIMCTADACAVYPVPVPVAGSSQERHSAYRFKFFLFVCICVAMEWILDHMDNFEGLRISLILFKAVFIFVFFLASSHVQAS